MRESGSIGRLVSILHRGGHLFINNSIETRELGYGQFKILIYLGKHEGASQNEIVEYFQLDKGTISFLIKKLEESGYIRKEKSKKDKRIHQLYLTQKAHERLIDFREVSQSWTQKLLKGFSEKEREEVFTYLERMIQNISKETEEEA